MPAVSATAEIAMPASFESAAPVGEEPPSASARSTGTTATAREGGPVGAYAAAGSTPSLPAAGGGPGEEREVVEPRYDCARRRRKPGRVARHVDAERRR